jgi:hypothetical protein
MEVMKKKTAVQSKGQLFVWLSIFGKLAHSSRTSTFQTELEVGLQVEGVVNFILCLKHLQ